MVIKDRKSPQDLRSARWFANDDLRGFGHRSRAMQMGYTPEDWRERPIIAMINTWSDINPCHTHLRERAKWVQRVFCKKIVSKLLIDPVSTRLNQ